MDFFKKGFSRLKAFWGKTGKLQRVLLVLMVVVVITAVAVAASVLNRTNYVVLYSGMDAGDAGETLAKLEEMGVTAKARGTGTIMVEEGQADEIRMELAAQGYPSSGLNYDIFSQASGLGTTDMEKKVYLQFQLQENIRKTLLRMDKVKDATVTVNMAEDSVFVLSENQKPASAAVMLQMEGDRQLSQADVKAVAELVSKSVPGLTAENVRIVDAQMNLYELNDEEDELVSTGSQLEVQEAVRKSLQEQVVNLLTPVFGRDHVLAEVNVRLNFDKESKESIEFSPPTEDSNEGLVTSLSELHENIAGYTGAEGTGTTGVDSNGDTPSYPAEEGEDGNSTYEKVSRDVTSQVNQTKTLLERAQGSIQELSVAVVLNNASSSEDYSENVINLVANAIGVDSDRISVEYLPFFEGDGEGGQQVSNPQETIQSGNQWKLLFIIAAGAFGVLLILTVILKKRNANIRAGLQQLQEEQGIDLTADEPLGPEAVEQMLTDSKNDKQVQVEEYIKKSPEAVAMLLRSWLSDG